MFTRKENDQLSHEISDTTTLELAWRFVRAAGGGAGIDRQTIEQFQVSCKDELRRLHELLVAEKYRFSRLRAAILPKEDGSSRKLGIPTVRDRVVLQAMKIRIEPKCESMMLNSSHAYRPGRGAMTALDAITAAMTKGLQFVFETDIRKFFDSIQHANLLRQVVEMEHCCRRSSLLGSSLRMSTGAWSARKGVAQGSPLSPLLSNVALTEFDRAVDKPEWVVVRYADDLAILCRSTNETHVAQQLVEEQLAKLGLVMHPGKTRQLDSRTESFSFLGFEFHPDRLAPDSKNLSKFRDSIQAWCNPHSRDSWQERIEQINGLVRSFAWYYHQTDCKRLFWTLDRFVQDSLAELESQIGPAEKLSHDQIVQMSRMREVAWNGRRKRKSNAKRLWNGYGG